MQSVNYTGWPRTISGNRGSITLSSIPQRIVSTSVTLTGTLLTIGANVIGSAATRAASDVADKQGFFTQWSDIAKSRGVVPLYQGEPNAEAVAAMNPDLIVVAGTGGDSALRVYDQLSQIAPTLVIDYDDKNWQELALLLGQATGREVEAEQVTAAFDRNVAETARKLVLPPQPTTALVYYEDGSGANIWTPASAQGKLLTALGFTLARVPDRVRASEMMGKRADVIQVGGEQFAEALNGQTLLLFAADEAVVTAVRQNRFLAHVPAVAAGRVHAMGRDTFRLDYYSARRLLDHIASTFS